MVKIVNPSTKKAYDFTFGADPELFVKKNGRLVSAYNLIKGDKKDPMKVPDGAVQVDGMALEFNIDPAADFKAFDKNLSSVMASLQSLVPDYEFFVQPVAQFGSAYIESQPKIAKELGCDPDFNAYTGTANPRPKGEMPFRTASGHIHIGWTKDVDPNDPTHFKACQALVKNLDVYLGIPSLVWDEQLAPGGASDIRRELYGAAGAFRPKPYGVEYRVLSNTWITDRVLRKTVFENTILAIKKTFEQYNKAGEQKFAVSEEEAVVDKATGKPITELTARDIVNKQPGWRSAAIYALEYSDIPSSRFYRNAMEKDAA
jgi:hypothetical protein